MGFSWGWEMLRNSWLTASSWYARKSDVHLQTASKDLSGPSYVFRHSEHNPVPANDQINQL